MVGYITGILKSYSETVNENWTKRFIDSGIPTFDYYRQTDSSLFMSLEYCRTILCCIGRFKFDASILL
jgi:hypothetical protein